MSIISNSSNLKWKSIVGATGPLTEFRTELACFDVHVYGYHFESLCLLLRVSITGEKYFKHITIDHTVIYVLRITNFLALFS